MLSDAVVFTNNVSSICICRKIETFFWKFCVKAGYFVYHNGCHLDVAIETDKMNLRNKILLLFVQTYQKREEVPYMEMSRENKQKRKQYPYKEVSRDTGEKKQWLTALKSLFIFHSQKSTRFFQLPVFYLVHPCPRTLQKPRTNWLAPTMWILARVKTDLDAFLGPKMIPTTWILN